MPRPWPRWSNATTRKCADNGSNAGNQFRSAVAVQPCRRKRTGAPGGPALGTEAAPALARAISIPEQTIPIGGGADPGGPGGAEGQSAPDINAVADKVYDLIRHRLTIERERRGNWL